jgi:PadR family transcriptional regulator PadR
LHNKVLYITFASSKKTIKTIYLNKNETMNVENTSVQMRKGILEYCILLVIQQGEAVYTSDLIDRLKQAQIIVVEGTLYPLLSRLHKSGILAYSWQESNAGPPRKYYRLAQPAGADFLKELNDTWAGLLASVQQVQLYNNPNANPNPQPTQ